jgi:hypothetical protein
MMKRLLMMGTIAIMLAACSSTGSGDGTTTGSTSGGGLGSLINVDISRVRAEIAENVNVALERVPITVQLPVTVAANVCGVDVNVLSVNVDTGDASCTATTTSPQLEQEFVNTII